LKSIDLQEYYTEIEYGEFEIEDVSEYASIKALNSSSLKQGDRTALHIDAALSGRIKYTKKEFDFGAEFHYMLFEPEKFNQLYYISKQHLGKKTNEDKAALKKELPYNGGKIRIDLKEGEAMKRMMEALYAHPGIRNLIEAPGVIERTLVWKDSDFGLNCKGRFDKLIHNDFIVDLKSTKDACEAFFPKDFKRFGYALQAAFYLDGYKALYPNSTSMEFAFIAIDKQEPYLPELYEVSEKTINEGRSKYKNYIKNYIDYKNNPDILYTSKVL
jgi:hypothetical protein